MADQEAAEKKAGQDSLEQALARARELSEQIAESARNAGQEMLDRYVGWLEDVAEQQRKLAASPPVSQWDWMAAMLNAQADFTRRSADFMRTFSSAEGSRS
jgi:hypothetical protein